MVLYVVGSTCLVFVYERESIVAMMDTRGCVDVCLVVCGRRCAVFMRRNDAALMTDDSAMIVN